MTNKANSSQILCAEINTLFVKRVERPRLTNEDTTFPKAKGEYRMTNTHIYLHIPKTYNHRV